MKIGFFTDTYFPQVSGVATSIKTLKEELEMKGHQVYIFTTTDPNAKDFEENVIRMPSVPFVSFKDRRIVVRGMWYSYLIAKELELDLIHTHTEFGAGILGKMVGKKMKIPVVHTYHTMYEDYLHYIAKGRVLRPSHVKFLSRLFVNHISGVVCPSERVINKLREYGITTPMKIIPTGINLKKFAHSDISSDNVLALRSKLGLESDSIVLLSLSRISYEKNIQTIIKGVPKIIQQLPTAKLVVVGDGPYTDHLRKLVKELNIEKSVLFVGEVSNDEVAIYYKAADYFVSASQSETQGLTYTEAMASGTQCIVEGNEYLDNLFNDYSLGVTYKTDDAFADTCIEYVRSNIRLNKDTLNKKLYEISSTCFGEKMFAFYNEAIEYHKNVLATKKTREISMDKIKIKFTSLRK